MLLPNCRNVFLITLLLSCLVRTAMRSISVRTAVECWRYWPRIPVRRPTWESRPVIIAATVFEVYRGKYMEPESIHGGKLYGVFLNSSLI